MPIPRRTLAVAGLLLGVLLIVAVGLLSLLQDPERYRSQIEAMLGEAVGRPVHIAGPLALSWRPSPTLSAREVSVAGEHVRVSMALVQVGVEPHALLARTLRARRVAVHGVQIDLDAAGNGAGPAPLPDLAALAVQEVELRDVAVLRAGSPQFAFDRVTLREAHSPDGARVDFATRIDGHDVRARARLRTAPGRVDLDALQLHLPVGVVSGQLRAELSGPRPQLSGELGADALTLGARGANPFASLSLELAAFAGVDASLRLRIGRLSLARFMVSEITAPLSWRDGKLDLRVAGVLAGGPLRATLHAGIAPAQFDLDLAVGDADAGSVLVMSGLTTAERGGSLALRGNLRAAGGDGAALLASLHGQVAVDVAGLTVRAGAAKLAAPDVLASLLRALQPGASDRVAIGCVTARFELRDGALLADNAIGMQSRTMNLLGSGRIALGEGEVELVLRPWRRHDLAPPAAGTAGTLLIWGPLADPQVGVSGETAVVDAQLQRDALSRLAGELLDRARGDAPCAQAAGTAVPPPGTAATPNPRAGVGRAVRVLADRRDDVAAVVPVQRYLALRVMRERGSLPATPRAHDTAGGLP